MDRTRCRRIAAITLQRHLLGASIVEAVIALPVLLVIVLGAIQFALVYEAKATLNHASLQAARLGAVRNADPAAIRRGLARGLAPLHAPESSLDGVARTVARIEADLPNDARIRILNPTREAFDDFGVDVEGEREIPNDRLHTLSTALGSRSGINIQDANLLKVQITYGYELQVPLVNWFITRVLLGVRGDADAFEQQLLRRTRLPIMTTATVRMQSPARLSDAVVSASDFPALDRIPADAAPPAPNEEEEEEDEFEGVDDGAGSTNEDDDEDGSSLADGFFGFGGGEADQGGGGTSGDGGGLGAGGGVNGGNPSQCAADPSPTPFPWDDLPGDSSPVPTPQPAPWFETSSSEAALESISLAALSVGNPIHVATGNKFQTEIDIPTLPGELAIGFRRHYNSAAVTDASTLGAGWRHSYQAQLRAYPNRIEIVQADGRLLIFKPRRGALGRFLAQRASDGEVIVADERYRWRWPSGRDLHFDTSGRLMSIREHERTTLLRYNEAGELVSVTDPQRRVLRFEYYPNGRLAKVRGPGRLGAAFRYDSRGNLVEAVGTDGNARRYSYEDARHPHHLSTISAGSVRPQTYGQRATFERIAHWTYDSQGRAVSSTHPDDAGKITLEYRDGFTEVTDAFNRTTRYAFDTRDGVAVVTDVRGPGCGCGPGDARFEYDDRFQPLEQTATAGSRLRYRYDSQGRIVGIERGDEWIVRYVYEGDTTRVIRIERPSVMPDAVATVELSYTASGRIERIDERGFTPRGDAFVAVTRVVAFSYDERGRLRRIDGPRDEVDDVTQIDYDEADRVLAVKGPAGEINVLAHDAAGRPTRIAQAGRPELKLTYNLRGQITSIAQLRSTGIARTTYSYDHAGRLVEQVDALGRRTRYSFDAAGRPSRMNRSGSDVTVGASYAPDDRIEHIAAIDRRGRILGTLYYAYDTQRRLIEIRDGEGAPLQQLQYHDDDALPDARVDPLGHITSFGYDDFGQIATVSAPDGGATRIKRDRFGRILSFAAPNGAITAYAYDDFGRRVIERSADRGVTRYRYDAANNLIEKQDARGARSSLTYDAANRLIRVDRMEGNSTLAYENGRLIRVAGEIADEHFLYDADGQLIEHRRNVDDHTFMTRFRYDEYGRLVLRQLPSGARMRYRYGEDGKLVSVTQARWNGDRPLVTANPGADSQAPALKALGDFGFGNGIHTKTSFDARSANVSRRAIQSVANLQYSYDAAHRITAIDRDGVQRAFDYDAVGRLTSESTPTAAVEFAYDTNGNRVRSSSTLSPSPAKRGRIGEGATTHYTYAPNSNRLTNIGDTFYLYDAAGNPLTIGARRYEYDTSGRPIKLYEHDRLIAEYRYNFWGERVQKIIHENGKRKITHYIYEQQKLIAEADDRGKITREYIYVDHHPVAILERGDVYWIHTDHLGTPIAVTDQRQVVVWKAEHQPFGTANVESDPDDDRRAFTLNLRFPGQHADAESGTHYNYLRDYDPQTGRYLTADPIGIGGGSNAFVYVSANPLSGADALGLYDQMVHYYMTYFLGLVAGLPQEVARTIAVATQYVDENPQTMPTREIAGVPYGSNRRALPLYHFVLHYREGAWGDRTDDVLTRFVDPWSNQLGNLYASTDPEELRRLWVAAHATGIPGECPMPDYPAINNARYQLFGEFLHAYEDTFAHRDSLNMPYAIASNPHNTPIADEGHFGLHGPSDWRDPDNTFNSDDRGRSACTILYVLAGPTVEYGLTEQECAARGRGVRALGSTFTPPPEEPSRCAIRMFNGDTDVVFGLSRTECAAAGNRGVGSSYTLPNASYWRYNELRTLRMEYEVLEWMKIAFGDEIERNIQNGGRSYTWEDLTGQPRWDDDPTANSRIGLEQSFEEWAQGRGHDQERVGSVYNLQTVLQQFNSSSADEDDRLEILNDWLQAHRLPRIESWDEMGRTAPTRRLQNIGWIPAGSLAGLLLPSDR